jgi:hypothetical protein
VNVQRIANLGTCLNQPDGAVPTVSAEQAAATAMSFHRARPGVDGWQVEQTVLANVVTCQEESSRGGPLTWMVLVRSGVPITFHAPGVTYHYLDYVDATTGKMSQSQSGGAIP